MSDQEEEAKDNKPEKVPPSLPEQVTLGLAFLLVVSLAVFLGWHGLQQATPGTKKAHPSVTARVDALRVQPQSQGWAVLVAIENVGNVPLREVIVKAQVRDADGKPGEREVTFGFLAEGASETAWVTTFTNPAEDAPTATVQSFQTKPEARGY